VATKKKKASSPAAKALPKKKAAKKTAKKKAKDTAANLGFEAKLWLAADKMRNNMDAAEYKHVVLGLIFLKYISDSFTELHAKLTAGEGEYAGNDRFSYLAKRLLMHGYYQAYRRQLWQHFPAIPVIDRDPVVGIIR